MEQLKEYCLKICCIYGVDTYIVSPRKYNDILEDEKLLDGLKIPRKYIEQLINSAREVGTEKLYLAFIRHPNRKIMEWEPIHCFKVKDKFYHVHYRKTWMCRECEHIVCDHIMMPMSEVDAVFYAGTENEYPDVPSIFTKIPCPKCGNPLQNHLLILSHMEQY